MNKPFTGKGDDGYSGLLGPGRVPKDHPRLEAIGNLDEATAVLGIVRASTSSEEVRLIILSVQRDLYKVMAEVAATKENVAKFRSISREHIDKLEKQIQSISEPLTLPNEFIIPGDKISSAYLALARTVVRRAERSLAKLFHSGELENRALLGYINRLSTLCYVLEMNELYHQNGQAPTPAKEQESQ